MSPALAGRFFTTSASREAHKYIQYIGVSESLSVVSDFLWPHGLQPTRLLCPWNSSSQNPGVSCPPPGDVPDPGIEPRFPVLQADSLPAELPGKSYTTLAYNNWPFLKKAQLSSARDKTKD